MLEEEEARDLSDWLGTADQCPGSHRADPGSVRMPPVFLCVLAWV